MDGSSGGKFSCTDCGRHFTWKPALAGKRAKCACGVVISIPAEPNQSEPDDLYALAPEPAAPAPASSGSSSGSTKRIPMAPRRAATESSSSGSAPYRPSGGGAAVATAAPTLGYQSGPTQSQKDRFSLDNLVDKKRDIYAPIVLIVVGLALYTAYYAIRYELSGGAIVVTGIGLGMLTLVKALLLMFFALFASGPLGVSFGGIGTAALKLAAMAVFCDGVTTWVDAWVMKISGMGGGIFAYGALSFPVALLIYWQLLIHLFSMDSSESWTVVMVLTVFDRFAKTALMLLLLATILNWGGVSPAASGLPSFGSSGDSGGSAALAESINEMKEMRQLEEARAYIAGGRQAALSGTVDALYAAGCKNVWFHVSRDINGRMTPLELVVELPHDRVKEKDKRDKCLQIIKAWNTARQRTFEADNAKDDGENYVFVGL